MLLVVLLNELVNANVAGSHCKFGGVLHIVEQSG